MMPLRGRGWLQGYNCQAVTSADGLIIAVSANNNPAAVITYTAMTAAAVQAAAVIANHRPTGTTPTLTPAAADTTGDVIGIVLADAGYLSEDNLTAPGPDRLIAGRQGPRGGTRRPHQPGTGTAAGHRGPHRGHGPPATHTGRDRDQPATQPHRRNPLRSRETQPRIPPIHQPGLRRAAAEWNYHGAVNNLFKAITTGHLTSATVPATG